MALVRLFIDKEYRIRTKFIKQSAEFALSADISLRDRNVIQSEN